MTDAEVRIGNLERLVWELLHAVQTAEQRVVGVEGNQWSDPGVAPGGGSGAWNTLALLGGSLANATSATAPTSASATLRTFDGTTVGANTTDNTITVFNFHNKTFASGALVFVGFALGAWWVIDARDCPT